MGKFCGFVQLEGELVTSLLTRSGDEPLNASSPPTFRIYGPNGLMTNGSGSTSFKDTGSISGATNASPIVVTSVNHGLTTGTRVTITGVTGNTGANGTFNVTVLSGNTFSLDDSTGNAPYTAGGTWNVTGLYEHTVQATSANGYEAGQTYSIVYAGTVNSAAWADQDTFTVV